MSREQPGIWHRLEATLLIALVPAVGSAASEDGARFISLEAKARELSHIVIRDPDATVAAHLERGGRAWANDIPLAAAFYNIALGHGVGGDLRVHILIEAARAEAAFGQRDAAMQHFLSALAEGRQTHHVASAFEGFVRVAEEAKTVVDLPDARRYVAALSHRGQLDTAALETIYRLARLLVRRADPRAEGILGLITKESITYRRALYMRGVLLLQRDDLAGAATLFEHAARLDPHPELDDEGAVSDKEVRELAWLAVGRLAFERGDFETGLVAYQWIPSESRHSNTAVFELGWLALEAKKPEAALAAFQTLETVSIETRLGRSAQLVRGFVMVLNGQYQRAATYYRDVARKFEQVLARYDAAVKTVGDLADLAQKCETRERALADPLLSPVLDRAEARAAWSLTVELEQLHQLATAIEQQIDGIDRALAGEGEFNPFQEIDRDRKHVREALEELLSLSAGVSTRAVTHAPRFAQLEGNTSAQPCCREPMLRARQLRERFEEMLRVLNEREEQLRTRLRLQRDEMMALENARRRSVDELEPAVRDAQRDAMTDATRRHRAELLRMVIEGDAGVLEAIWRYKEDHRAEIAAAERERREKILELEAELQAKLVRLEEPLNLTVP